VPHICLSVCHKTCPPYKKLNHRQAQVSRNEAGIRL